MNVEERTSTPAAPARAGEPRRGVPGRRMASFFAVAAAAVAADQVSKALIRAWLERGETWPGTDGLLQLSHVENSGAAFGIFQGSGLFLLLTTTIGVAAVLVYLFFVPLAGRLYTVALAMILGGAVGNLIDRAFRGTVTDFIDPAHYPSFNLADSAIVLGVLALGWLSLRDGGEHHEADGR